MEGNSPKWCPAAAQPTSHLLFLAGKEVHGKFQPRLICLLEGFVESDFSALKKKMQIRTHLSASIWLVFSHLGYNTALSSSGWVLISWWVISNSVWAAPDPLCLVRWEGSNYLEWRSKWEWISNAAKLQCSELPFLVRKVPMAWCNLGKAT